MKTREHIYVERMIALLVESFGIDVVQRVLANVMWSSSESNGKIKSSVKSKRRKRPRDVVFTSTRDNLSEMRDFLIGVEQGALLPDVDDVRQLATFAGLKQLPGKTRRDLLRSLLRSLDSMTEEKLLPVLREAAQISAAHRKDGLAVLTDKILEGVSSDSAVSAKSDRR